MIGLLALLTHCASPVALEPNEAYILSRVGYTDRLVLRGISFRNVDTGEDVLVEPGLAVLTRVPAGHYYMRKIRSAYDNVIARAKEQPDELIPVAAGHVNYIGSFIVAVPKETHNTLYQGVDHTYPEVVVEQARAEAPEVFARYPFVVARPQAEKVGAD